MEAKKTVSLSTRLRFYNIGAKQALLYCGGALPLTQKWEHNLQIHHQSQLRRLLGIRNPRNISRLALYERTNSRPIGIDYCAARWALFKRVLTLPERAPPYALIIQYLSTEDKTKAGQGKLPTSIYSTINNDLKRAGLKPMLSIADLRHLRGIANQTRRGWKALVRRIVAAKSKEAWAALEPNPDHKRIQHTLLLYIVALLLLTGFANYFIFYYVITRGAQ